MVCEIKMADNCPGCLEDFYINDMDAIPDEFGTLLHVSPHGCAYTFVPYPNADIEVLQKYGINEKEFMQIAKELQQALTFVCVQCADHVRMYPHRSKWVPASSYGNASFDTVKCEVCGKVIGKLESETYDYCPYCGAIMKSIKKTWVLVGDEE